MAIGVISDEDFESEVSRSTEVKPSTLEIVTIERGRGSKLETPEIVRDFIAEESIRGASAQELAKSFNISPSSIAAYKNGATSTATYDTPNDKLKTHIDKVKDQIVSKAKNRLSRALNRIDNDKLDGLDAKELSGVAKDMASIVDKMSPKADPTGNAAGVHLHIYAPKMKQIEDYDIIEG